MVSKEEQQVIGLKRMNIRENIRWTCDADLLDQFITEDLFKSSFKYKFKDLSNEEQGVEVLNELVKNGKAGDLNKMAVILESTNVEANRWLADEIWEELAVVKKMKVKYEKYIQFEAKYLVHRTFGGNKKISEGEKATIIRLVVERTQCVKNIYVKYISRLSNDAEVQLAGVKYKEKCMKKISDDVQYHIEKNIARIRVPTKQLSVLRTSDYIPQASPYERISLFVDGITALVASVTLATEHLDRELKRALLTAKIKPMRGVQVEKEIINALEKYVKDGAAMQTACIELDTDIAKLEQDVRDLKIDKKSQEVLHGKDKIIRLLKAELSHHEESYESAIDEAQRYRTFLAESRQELRNWKGRKANLSTNKSLKKMAERSPSVVRFLRDPTMMVGDLVGGKEGGSSLPPPLQRSVNDMKIQKNNDVGTLVSRNSSLTGHK